MNEKNDPGEAELPEYILDQKYKNASKDDGDMITGIVMIQFYPLRHLFVV